MTAAQAQKAIEKRDIGERALFELAASIVKSAIENGRIDQRIDIAAPLLTPADVIVLAYQVRCAWSCHAWRMVFQVDLDDYVLFDDDTSWPVYAQLMEQVAVHEAIAIAQLEAWQAVIVRARQASELARFRILERRVLSKLVPVGALRERIGTFLTDAVRFRDGHTFKHE
ncbi:MAG: hypothetical protein Q7V62_03710 [Actinomycetota bacterium]|nr:hypothetical protein [Actinomycetota bacterium]